MSFWDRRKGCCSAVFGIFARGFTLDAADLVAAFDPVPDRADLGRAARLVR